MVRNGHQYKVKAPQRPIATGLRLINHSHEQRRRYSVDSSTNAPKARWDRKTSTGSLRSSFSTKHSNVTIRMLPIISTGTNPNSHTTLIHQLSSDHGDKINHHHLSPSPSPAKLSATTTAPQTPKTHPLDRPINIHQIHISWTTTELLLFEYLCIIRYIITLLK